MTVKISVIVMHRHRPSSHVRDACPATARISQLIYEGKSRRRLRTSTRAHVCHCVVPFRYRHTRTAYPHKWDRSLDLSPIIPYTSTSLPLLRRIGGQGADTKIHTIKLWNLECSFRGSP